jgi:hypothetical protein
MKPGMPKQEVIKAFYEFAVPDLRNLGFVGDEGHFLRRVGAVTQVIELQHSVYGGRVTVNLGLGLEWMPAQIRWVPPAVLGPHAHDCARWVRLGLVSPARKDTWWTFTEDETSAPQAVGALAETLLHSGLHWLDNEQASESFAKHALERLERSKSKRNPSGAFQELRMMGAIAAWQKDDEAAQRYLELAKKTWGEEKARLQGARQVYKNRHAQTKDLAEVPDLLQELSEIISPTTGAYHFSAELAAEERRLKFGLIESAPAK